MRGIWGAALAAAVMGAMGPTAVAAAEGARGITGPELVEILQGAGYKAQLAKADDGDPRISTRMGGVGVTVDFFDCEAGRCGSLQFATALDLEDGLDPGTIEAFNNQYRYVNATRDAEGDPVLRFDFEVLHTAHQGHVLSQIDTWESLLDEFVRVSGWRD